MSDIQEIGKKASEALTSLEKIVSGRILMLSVSAVCCADVWMIGTSVDPRALSIASVAQLVKAASVASVIIFVLGFMVLMASFFPGTRLATCYMQRAC